MADEVRMYEPRASFRSAVVMRIAALTSEPDNPEKCAVRWRSSSCRRGSCTGLRRLLPMFGDGAGGAGPLRVHRPGERRAVLDRETRRDHAGEDRGTGADVENVGGDVPFDTPVHSHRLGGDGRGDGGVLR